MGGKNLKCLLCAVAFCAGSALALTVSNPIIWSDSPDPSIVRVEDNYYMVTTTMHYAPGIPIFKSTDLAQWRTIGYVYQTLINNDNMNLDGGKDAYGKGSWASSIRYRQKDGYYYVLTPSYTSNKTHLYKTKDIEAGPWSEVQLPFYHDPSLFFDDDGTAWVFYGSGDQISYVQLNDDASGVKAGGKSGKIGGVSVNQVTGTTNYYVQQEGSHMEKVNGEYYLFTISWPAGACRTEIVYRSKSLLSGFSGRIFLQDNGVAQGGIFDTPEGKWYALLFRDSGPVGRISHLVPMVWKDGWPEPTGGTKSAPKTLDLPVEYEPGYGMVTSDDFESDDLALEWQWNHNPDNKNWSLKANSGNLRITTSRVDSRIVNAKNMLTQRTFGPKCVGRTLVDGSGMKDGDIAGLAAWQDNKGYVAIAKESGRYNVVMYQGTKDGESLKDSKALSSSKVYLRVDFDLPIDRGTASFYYSEDGKTWNKIGTDVSLSFDLHMFVGNRFGLFNYATKAAGGYVDFDWFKIGVDANDEIFLKSMQDTMPPMPYGGIVAKIPGIIEVENFDVGKSKQAYYDSDSKNEGVAYREEPVDIVQIDSNGATKGYAVGYTHKGEWLRYTVNVEKAGSYAIRARVATASETSGFQLLVDNTAIMEALTVPKMDTTWNVYKEIDVGKTSLEAGEHALKLLITGDYVNIDWLQFCAGDSCTDKTSIREAAIRYVNSTSIETKIFSVTGRFLGNLNLGDEKTSEALKAAGYVSGVYLLRYGGKLSRVIVK